MKDVGPVAWPPAPIRTERLVLRAPRSEDRATYVDLLASAEVHAYLGGARPREEVERDLPAVPEQQAGTFVVTRDGAMIGLVLLRRADRHHRAQARHRIDLAYLFLPQAWGHGYAEEACRAALDWLSGVLPDEPVMLTTQTANAASMRLAVKVGFVEVERFHAWDAEQWLGRRNALGRPAVDPP